MWSAIGLPRYWVRVNCAIPLRDDNNMWSLLLLLIPLDTVFKLDARTTKDVQRTANGQVDFAVAQSLH